MAGPLPLDQASLRDIIVQCMQHGNELDDAYEFFNAHVVGGTNFFFSPIHLSPDYPFSSFALRLSIVIYI
jgi:hypothetical protein